MHAVAVHRTHRRLLRGSWFGLLAAHLLAGCITNPVTGHQELGFVSRDEEIEIGERQYEPSQQMQGGVYTTDPALSTYVSDVGQRLAAASNVALPYEFVVLDNSLANAWALPGGKIAVNRGLLVMLDNEAELAAVLGHEIVHAAARHSAKNLQTAQLMQTGLALVKIGTANTAYGDAVIGAARRGAELITYKYGRDAEREADFYGNRYMVHAGYDVRSAVTLQEKFVELYGEQQRSFVAGLFASHPPSRERVRNNRSQVARLPKGGELHSERYGLMIETLRSRQTAFDAYDTGLMVFADGDFEAAATHAAEAIRIAGDEPAFHGLRGRARLAQGRFEDAIINFDRALALRKNYYEHTLGRGLAAVELGNDTAARADLEHSTRLLPTAPAYRGLGRIAERAGNTDLAMRYYEAAAQSESDAGRAAKVRYIEIDVKRRPAQYVQGQIVDTESGPALKVTNRAGVALADVYMRVRLSWADGSTQELDRRFELLPAGHAFLAALPKRNPALVDARAYAVSASVAP